MTVLEVKEAWNAQADHFNQWDTLDADERLRFALLYVSDKTRQALGDLHRAVYAPGESAMSVAHAIGHVKQILEAK